MPDSDKSDHERLIIIEQTVLNIQRQLQGLPCTDHSSVLGELRDTATTNKTRIGSMTWLFGIMVGLLLTVLGLLVHHLGATPK